MELPQVVSPQEWDAAHQELLAKEKELTRASDALAAERRRQPMEKFSSDYVFEGPSGKKTLPELFNGRPQLIVYHFMLQPGQEDPCGGCSMFTDNVGRYARLHLAQRDTEMVWVSRAPIDEIEVARERMGWDIPWFSAAGNSFPDDNGIGQAFGYTVFLRDGDDVYRTYFTRGRGVETIGTFWEMLDRTPLGRQETWEDSPAGWPQDDPYSWVGLHDTYSEEPIRA